MKIISSTKRISMYGVILISDMAPFFLPTFIAIVDPFLYPNDQGRASVKPSRAGGRHQPSDASLATPMLGRHAASLEGHFAEKAGLILRYRFWAMEQWKPASSISAGNTPGHRGV
jgi:hypothetical protein